jgi:peptidoglycan/xylan/chitin deacetylase (PgdA/CDA1 family)
MSGPTHKLAGMGKKEALARLLAALRIPVLAARLRTGPSRTLAILAYHRVFDIGCEEDFPFDPELVSASIAEFTWQMETLHRLFRPLHLAEAVRRLDEGRPLPPRAVAVTFDDGHRDNYTHAFPVLQRLGVPATIFLSTGYMNQEETFWFDEVAFRLYRTPRRELDLRTLGLRLALGSVTQRRRATEEVLSGLKAVSNGERLAALRELAAESGVEGTAGDPRSRPLTWDQVMEMQKGGIEFGSHTVSHPVLSRLRDDELRRELSLSRRELEQRLGRQVELLAYPVGGETDFDDRVVGVARECGYRMALTYVSGTNAWPPDDCYRLRRLHVERYTTRARFTGMLAFPRLFG